MPRQITTDRLLLRSWIDDDAPVIRALWAERDPRSIRRLSEDGRPTVEEMRERLRSQLAASESTGIRLYGAQNAEGQLLGYCGLIEGRSSTAEPELAFELLKSAHGRGYATEAARAVVAASDTSGRDQLWSTVREWNQASQRVLAKVGFSTSGRTEPDVERGEVIWMSRRRARGDNSPHVAAGDGESDCMGFVEAVSDN